MKNSSRVHKIEKFDIRPFYEERNTHLDECYYENKTEDPEKISPPDAISQANKFIQYPTIELKEFEDISAKIKKVRTAFGITQKQMATVLNMSQPSYSDIEKEGNMPSAKTMSAIAAFFNISLSYFYGLTDKFYLLNDRRTFYKVNGYCLLDFVSDGKIFDIMVENNDEYYYEEIVQPLYDEQERLNKIKKDHS